MYLSIVLDFCLGRIHSKLLLNEFKRVLVFYQFGIPYRLNCSKTPVDTSLLSWAHIIQTANFLSIMQWQQFIFNLRALRNRTFLGQSCWLGFHRYQLRKFNVLEQKWTKHYIFNLILCFQAFTYIITVKEFSTRLQGTLRVLFQY